MMKSHNFRLLLISSIFLVVWKCDAFVESQQQNDPIDYEYDEPVALRVGLVGQGNKQQGHAMDYDEFLKEWPPKKRDGTPFDLSPDKLDESQREWDKLLEELTKEYEDRTKDGATARAIPLCVDGLLPDDTNKDDPDLKGFKEVFEDINKKQANFADTSSIFADKNGASNSKSKEKFVNRIAFKSIYSPPQPPDGGVGVGRLNQWVHIIVDTVGLEGLFIQAISGPVGLPFGDFRHDFNCKITDPATDPDFSIKEMDVTIKPIVPCKFRPRASVRHPTVYAYKVKTGTQNKFRVHFNWEDVKCANNPRMQFLIIAIQSFKNLKYEVVLTQAYEQDIDSPDGIPWPYYLEWKDTMECKDNLVDEKTEKKYQFSVNQKRSTFSILYNKKYDDCILSRTDLTDAGCPPGPFACDEDDHKIGKINNEGKFNELLELYRKESFLDNCIIQNCPHPKDTIPYLIRTTKAPPTIDPDDPEPDGAGDDGSSAYEVEQVINNFVQATRGSRGTHGHLMILAYMVLMATGSFWARFYKESGGLDENATKGFLGIGRWLWGHILISFVALAVLWVGLTEVIQFKRESLNCSIYKNPQFQDDCTKRKVRVTLHKSIGSLSVLLFHVSFFTGWFRPLTTYRRVLWVTSHWVTGYLGKVFAIISVFVFAGLNSFCVDILLEIIAIEIISVAFFVGATFLQKTEDFRLGLPLRKLFPIIDAVEVRDEKSPCDLIRFVLVIASWVLHMLFYGLVFLTYFNMFELRAGESKLNVSDTLKCGIGKAHLPSAKENVCVYMKGKC